MKAKDIIALGEHILEGGSITYPEALQLTETEKPDIPLLAAYANKIRHQFSGDKVEMCGVINVRSGRCSEDCSYCAQSAFHTTQSPVYDLLSEEDILERARAAQRDGANRISLVTSGKGMEHDPDFPRILSGIRAVIRRTGLRVCANLGTLTAGQVQDLVNAGIKRYAHNLETSERYYPDVCSTHPYQERLRTVRAAKAAGLELCTGGIIGLGENWQDRIDLAFALREIDADSVPLNILNPIKGTALEGAIPLPALEIIQTFAIFRFILPGKIIRPAGGREINLRDLQGTLMLSGANGLIIGNYLTFSGRQAAHDFTMVQDAGMTAI
ncbi:biotin synthase BioB [Acetonema longum]|uniref:Biotin synthase n=1 Tax=Acetonema longum DSM 6540 TaxID=1009370 RepID=F7NGP3_9FIRM|nr:biotin synthase BioB [Acetonema longum]EGO64847.1 biotin synthase [Acetonema longum DSM 6540]